MYTFVSYLTYAVGAVVISASIFFAIVLFLLIDTGIQRLTRACRRLIFQAIHSNTAQGALRTVKDSVHAIAEQTTVRTLQPAVRTLDHAIHVLAAQSVLRATRHHGAAEHTR